MLMENDKMTLDNEAVSEIFNNYFSQIVDFLYLYEFPSEQRREYTGEIDNIMLKFKAYPSIVKIKKHFKIETTFSFSSTSKDEIVAIIKDLQNNKAAGGEIFLNILKKSNFTYDESTDCVNYTSKNRKFPDFLKNANITPVHKKDDPTDKVNYRPVSVLSLLSKIFERVIYNRLGEYMDLFLSKLLCGFRKAHSSQQALFKLLIVGKKNLITRVLLAHGLL